MDLGALPLDRLCGQLIVGGFAGPQLPASFAKALGAGERGGAILFRRNCVSLEQVALLCAAIHDAALPELPPFIGVDQEGGRVRRLPAPFLSLPAMRTLGRVDDVELTERAGCLVGTELRALGFNIDFAPVLDVDSNPDNPVIGDRSFGRDPHRVSRHGLAFVQGLQRCGVLACGKHFPGHGDTAVDSHVALPVVDASLEQLRRVELAPFVQASRGGVAALMSAHVVYRTIDARRPATLCPELCTSLLREEIRFEGVLFSDDLEMAAITTGYGIGEAAVQAVAAGCDALLICSDESLQETAREALIQRAEQSEPFAARCRQALGRALAHRQRCPAASVVAGLPPSERSAPVAAKLLAPLVDTPAAQQLSAELAGRAAASDADVETAS